MPIYEYQCQSCGNRSETIQRMSDPPLETCEECGGALRKLISAPAFQFKGSGWYVTDYGRKGGGEKKEGEKASKDGSKDGAKDGSGDTGKSSDTSSSGGGGSDSGNSQKASTGMTKTERMGSGG